MRILNSDVLPTCGSPMIPVFMMICDLRIGDLPIYGTGQQEIRLSRSPSVSEPIHRPVSRTSRRGNRSAQRSASRGLCRPTQWRSSRSSSGAARRSDGNQGIPVCSISSLVFTGALRRSPRRRSSIGLPSVSCREWRPSRGGGWRGRRLYPVGVADLRVNPLMDEHLPADRAPAIAWSQSLATAKTQLPADTPERENPVRPTGASLAAMPVPSVGKRDHGE